MEETSGTHTLVLTKTKASHERAAQQYQQDTAAIQRLRQLLSPGALPSGAAQESGAGRAPKRRRAR